MLFNVNSDKLQMYIANSKTNTKKKLKRSIIDVIIQKINEYHIKGSTES